MKSKLSVDCTVRSLRLNQPGRLGRFHLPKKPYDKETGTFYNYFRDYDPGIGRYVQSDPIGLASGSMNTYAYVENQPLFYVDPYGLEAFQDAKGRPCKCKNIKVLRKGFCTSCGEDGDKEWGHYWVELGSNESYGWWPTNTADGNTDAITGVSGSLNRGRRTDPYQGNRDNLDDNFNPRPNIWPSRKATCEQVCARAAQCVRNFARSYGGTSWSLLGLKGDSCQTFQNNMLNSCNLGK